MIRAWTTLMVCIAMPLWGGEILSVDYDDLAGQLPGLVDFEGFATQPEPGHSVPRLLTFPGLTIGALLHGQSLRPADGFDVLDGQPSMPIRASMGGKDAAIAVAYHAGFGSNAAFPLGPDGFAKRSGRGEGALALVLDGEASAFAIKLHADYPDPLGIRPAPGLVTLTFYDPSGEILAQHDLHPAHGVNEIGLLITPPAKAITLTHRDPGGIAVDDIRYAVDRLGS